MTTNRDKSGRFVAGQSGNPRGRPREDPDARAILKAATPDAARALVELLKSKRENIRFTAAQEILNRTQGKPEQMSKIQLSSADDKGIIFKWIDTRIEHSTTENKIAKCDDEKGINCDVDNIEGK